jgi:hypothetical protein
MPWQQRYEANKKTTKRLSAGESTCACVALVWRMHVYTCRVHLCSRLRVRVCACGAHVCCAEQYEIKRTKQSSTEQNNTKQNKPDHFIACDGLSVIKEVLRPTTKTIMLHPSHANVVHLWVGHLIDSSCSFNPCAMSASRMHPPDSEDLLMPLVIRMR